MCVDRLDVLDSLIDEVITAFVSDQTLLLLLLLLLLYLFLLVFFSGRCRSLIDPPDGPGLLNHRIFVVRWWDRSHLRIHESISQE